MSIYGTLVLLLDTGLREMIAEYKKHRAHGSAPTECSVSEETFFKGSHMKQNHCIVTPIGMLEERRQSEQILLGLQHLHWTFLLLHFLFFPSSATFSITRWCLLFPGLQKLQAIIWTFHHTNCEGFHDQNYVLHLEPAPLKSSISSVSIS